MTTKTTKRALLMSVLSLVLCMSMLVGSTFAWFTDSASTGVNKIQSGILDVALEVSYDGGNTWENAEGKTLDFVKAPGYEDEDILWEPGCTYQLPMLRVVNDGNLWLKYQIAITGIKGDAKLNEAIEWSYNKGALDLVALNQWQSLAPAAASEGFIIMGHMKEDAGNEYQNLTIDGIGITVFATQKDAEYDSFDNKYDQFANRKYVTVTNQEELNVAIANATEPTAISLAAGNYTLPTISSAQAPNTKDILFAGAGDTTIDMTKAVTAANASLSFKNIDLVFDNDNYEGFQHAAKLVYENCSFTGTQFLYAPNVQFINCTFDEYDAATEYSVWTYGAENVSFTGCTFNTHGKAILIYNEVTNGNFIANVTLTNCTLFSDGTVDTEKAAIETGSNGGNTETSNKYNISVNNCDVIGFGISPKGTVTNSTVWSNKNEMDAEHLKVTINGVNEMQYIKVEEIDAFQSATAAGGLIVLENDIVVNGDYFTVSTETKTIIDLNGKTLKVEGEGSAATDRLFYTQPGSDLVITGNGTIDFGDSISSIAVGGYGNITIENGTFIRNRYTNADEFYPLIENTKNAAAGTKFVINGGYFDSGYYNLKEDGTPDCFNNCRQLINSTWSNCDIVVYGGTFVGANPAWGDEGMTALCTVCGGNTYCQQAFLAGQNRTDTELPDGYAITESVLEDGRPVFTVSYSK